jgi:hypothetical protein
MVFQIPEMPSVCASKAKASATGSNDLIMKRCSAAEEDVRNIVVRFQALIRPSLLELRESRLTEEASYFAAAYTSRVTGFSARPIIRPMLQVIGPVGERQDRSDRWN